MAQTVKNLPAMQETRVQSLGQENPLKKGMATHSCILDEHFLIGFMGVSNSRCDLIGLNFDIPNSTSINDRYAHLKSHLLKHQKN